MTEQKFNPRGANKFFHPRECDNISQLQRDAELVRPERCTGCEDYSYTVSVTPSCKREHCERERARYSMENIVMTDSIIDDLARPSVLGRLRKFYRRGRI